ncbi:bifunctional proline dehydrogenase/L-glutamate gamma-semialdehyde dehydrogenase PutA [Pseudaminobacter sp. 19-2017]|uniref:Bifunctional protein PutA n=1 Tax=Pseudaminobacter soli (ex Zhang et al. 2022) TaxID=2831468 RepID=A0A942DYS8_9HYPH|nr:bifunctional proline dehydrogenase/L-glutamate gamma-semialdehyde dehydrogenase PutA [Pseudaminobacter soli]MBS3647515.1 bifunctional proline dehydrogenase/L-glutamate gamma-semialdehyde dehydrogenase PutA [Pseudaminobacter soli]
MTKPALDELRRRIRENYLPDEGEALSRLVGMAQLTAEERTAICARAADLVRAVRASSDPRLMEVFLSAYGLSTKEGVALMCLAEALLRVPDAQTVDELIQDKIAPHDWSAHSGSSSSIFVNASTWALMLTGRVLEEGEGGIAGTLRAMVRRLGEPVIRRAVAAAMREMGEQFVLGRTIEEAVRRGSEMTARGYLYSYDMLGEAARTEADALRYLKAYADAIAALRQHTRSSDIRENPGISVKLSAIHPRYEMAQRETMLPVMSERLLSLALAAREARMGLNIDAEEADRLDLSLDVIDRVLADPKLKGWDGFGVVVQAYGPRAPFVIDWLHALGQRLDRRIMVRLVKGAYWDTEIKRAQVMGLSGYPVFTRKPNTDVSYLACARKLLDLTDRIYPQFATHNAHTVAAILNMAGDRNTFEFQRLHGMGETLHEAVRSRELTRCRIYAPVGAHSDLLAYLVRRLLENGANSSFVHQVTDASVPTEEIARDPLAVVESQATASNPAIPKPAGIFGPTRKNAQGWDITDPDTLAAIEEGRAAFAGEDRWSATPTFGAPARTTIPRAVVNPARPEETVGTVVEATIDIVRNAVGIASEAQAEWARRPVADRAAILRRAADLYEENAVEFFALCTREAGKTLADGVAEVREAVDFLRYYAAEAARVEGGTEARGVIACISPWNFPLAIFTGQVAAALVTGSAVIAKPAEQTPLIAAKAVSLLHQAGIPQEILQLVPGDGPSVGAPLTADSRIAGVCFTGSTEVARQIERQLARSGAPDAMLVAETGGLNAMIVDSTALPEQAVRDILASAFQSAGQRCSALRILYVQKDVAPKVLEMLTGALKTLVVGDPWSIETDVGPVIDYEARGSISGYCRRLESEGRLIAKLDTPGEGRFVAPHIFGVSGIEDVEKEVFGPVLHVATFEADDIDDVISAINARGYGLTFGLHTRIEARVQHIVDRIRAGNIYVNRNQIGAVVGAQPFGGEGLSGTGPKAGGPHYLRRFRRASGGLGETVSGIGVTVRKASAAELDQALRGVNTAEWAARPDRVPVLRKLLRGRAAEAIAAAAGLDFGPLDLPGPTGEANTLVLRPRGNVLCLGPDADTLLAQVVQALAAGNAVLGVAPGARTALQPLTSKDLPIRVVDGVIEPDDLATPGIDAVAFCGSAETASSIRRVLSGQAGPIAPVITEAINPVAYAHERSICVDTTAAGGNASLLAGAD